MVHLVAVFCAGALAAGLYGAGVRKMLWRENVAMYEERAGVIQLASAAKHVGSACAMMLHHREETP